MRTQTVYKTFNTKQRREFVRITEDVQAAVDESGIMHNCREDAPRCNLTGLPERGREEIAENAA